MNTRFALATLLGCLTMTFSLALDAIAQETSDEIKPTGKIEQVQSGFAFTEGPAWDPKSQALYFTDIPNNAIHRTASDGTVSLFTDQSKHSNGILIPKDGRLLACQMDGQVVEYDRDTAEAKVIASQYNGKRFNAPNDLTVDQNGGIYFTDPLFRAPTPLPQTAQAVYYVSPDGNVTRVTEDLPAPNGIGLSTDAKRLYVCPSQQAEMLVYDVTEPGKLENRQVFCVVKQPEGKTDTGADGIALDQNGNVYITTHLGVQFFSPSGKMLGLVEFPEHPANVSFGGKDWKTMFVTARTGLYKVRMPIAGFQSGDF